MVRRYYDWTVFVDYGEGSGNDGELDVASASSLAGAVSAAQDRVAHDIIETLSGAQEELKRVAATYDQPSAGDYRTRIEEAVNEHEAAYAQDSAGTTYLRMVAAESSAESVVNDDPSAWWTPDKVRELATTDTESDRSVRQTVYIHDEWQYRIHVDLDA